MESAPEDADGRVGVGGFVKLVDVDDGNPVLLDAPVVRDPGLRVFAEHDRAVAASGFRGDGLDGQSHFVRGEQGAHGLPLW